MTLLLMLTGYPQGGQGDVGEEQPISGQPMMVRGQFHPHMAGYRDRIGKWNMVELSEKVKTMLRGMKLHGRLSRA